ANKKTIFVKQGELAVAELTDKVISAEPGEYNLKVRLKRDDQKTEKEITEVLEILPQTLTQTTGLKAVKKEVQEELNSSYFFRPLSYPKLIYESPQEKSKGLALYFFIGTLALYASFITFTKKPL
ncbi:MAG TPA: hypothetical protein VFF28_01675, partial [Candidatus Nanoarchaeia archaeon]|nr:hypothetical protein [Candidatus Nanoarchaeia archaeon]